MKAYLMEVWTGLESKKFIVTTNDKEVVNQLLAQKFGIDPTTSKIVETFSGHLFQSTPTMECLLRFEEFDMLG